MQIPSPSSIIKYRIMILNISKQLHVSITIVSTVTIEIDEAPAEHGHYFKRVMKNIHIVFPCN